MAALLDDELSAMKKVGKLLDGLTPKARNRVLEYVTDRYCTTQSVLAKHAADFMADLKPNGSAELRAD